MLTTAQSNFFDYDTQPTHQPIIDKILYNLKPESSSRFKKLEKEEHELLIKIATICHGWRDWVFSTKGPFKEFGTVQYGIFPKPESGFKAIDHPIFEQIFSNVKPETPTIFRRIEGEDEQLFINIATVCKEWRNWVFSPNKGPFKQLGKDHYRLLPKDIPWNLFLGIVNQEIMKNSEDFEPWFHYLDSVKNGIEAKCPID
ncbi:MAG TPA: hypothetical protein VGP47_03605, partial [Parachlamydiaceae bacterium]|nr:hypothetical protein [Parachlamydiaceae bacterium]